MIDDYKPAITSLKELKVAIALLEQRRADAGQAFRAQVHTTIESMKPVNLLKSALQGIFGAGSDNSIVPVVAGSIGSLILKKVIPMAGGNLIGKAMAGVAAWALSRWAVQRLQRNDAKGD
ncbi:MAG TPA: hypothetical protein VKR32_06260 [Puia sp.]|nr:hypothetical protein [Puia sp.]